MSDLNTEYLEDLEEDLTAEEIETRYFSINYYGIINGKWVPLVDFDPFCDEKNIMYDDGTSYVWVPYTADLVYLRADIFKERYPEYLI